MPFRRVRDQRELADDERGTSRVEQRAVELARLVLEDAQAGDLAGETFRFRFGVALGDAEEDDETAPISPPGVEHARVTR